MAKTSKAAEKKIEKVMHEFGRGKLKSSSGATVTNQKQAVAIALSEAREEGLKVPPPPAKPAVKKMKTAKTATKKPATRKK